MSKEKLLVPHRRFKEFQNAGTWEQRRLGDIVSFAKGFGYSKKDLSEKGTPIILYGQLYTKYETVIKNVATLTKVKNDTVYSNGGEVIVPASGETAEDIARASVVDAKGIILGGDLNIIHTNEDINSIFLALNISNGTPHKEIAKRAQGKSIVHLHNSDLAHILLNYPSMREQEKISLYFQHLNNLITLHQRKIDKLKKLKDAYLNEMFPFEGERKPKRRFYYIKNIASNKVKTMSKKESLVPYRRFKEFKNVGAWEQHKLGELGSIITGNTPETSENSYWSTSSFVWITPSDIKSSTISDSIKHLSNLGWEKARKVPAYSLLVTCIASIGKNTINVVPAAFNQQINALVPVDNDVYFLLSLINQESSRLSSIAGQTATAIINKKTLEKFDVVVPKLQEQKKIGKLFSKLDDLITFNQHKLNKSKKLKSAYLNEMFPTEGEYKPKHSFTEVSPIEKEFKPKRRFAEFTDNWEQHKLGDISEIYDGVHQTPDYKKSGVMFLSVENISNLKSNKFISQEDFENNFKVSPKHGDILMTRIGNVGTPNVVESTDSLAFYVSLALIKPKLINPYFLCNSIESPITQANIQKRTLTTAIPQKINKDEIKNVEIKLPRCQGEQAKIGNFFQKINCLITFHQSKIDKVKELKSAYLNEMFPVKGERKSKHRCMEVSPIEKEFKPKRRFAEFTDNWEQHKFGDNLKSIHTGTSLLGSDSNLGIPLLKMGNINRGCFSLNKIDFLRKDANIDKLDLIKKGDFLFNTRNTLELVGKGATWTGESNSYAFNSNIARFTFEGIDTIFFNYLYNTDSMIKQIHSRATGTTSVAAVYPRDIVSISYLIPKLTEQKKIGHFFNQLDTFTLFYRDKIDKLKKLKAAYLNEMFPVKGEYKPKRRFIINNWEQHKLGDVAKITMGQSPKGDSYHNRPIGEILVQGNSDFENGYVKPRVWTTKITKEADKGDIIMSVRAPAGEVGKTNYHVVLGRGVAAIKGNEFIYQLLYKMSHDGYWKKYSTGSIFDSLNSEMLMNAEIKLPSIEEQDKIGYFFNQLDTFITFHRDKIDKLKKLKSAYLNEMFPFEGEYKPKRRFTTVFPVKKRFKPKRRFAGFTDDWEQHKLGDIVKITMGQSPNGSSYHNKPIGRILVQGNADFENGYVKPRIWTTQITKEANKGDIIMSVRAPAGEVGKTNYHVVIGRGVTAIKGNEFIYQLLTKMNADNYWKKYSTGSTFESLNSNTISSAEVKLPNLEEQRKIGTHFKQLDNLITLHQRKIDKFKKLKNAYLTEVFPTEGEYKPKRRFIEVSPIEKEFKPKRRFAEFTDNWEQHKFKDILKTYSFRPYLADVSENGEYEVIQQGDKPIVGYSDGEPFMDYKDITLFGDHTVSLYKPQRPFFVATDGVKILIADKLEGDYLYTSLERYKPEPQGYKRHFTILKNQIVWFTENIEEQRKIGEFFKQLSHFITLYQSKIDKVKELKNAYLNEMFPTGGEYKPKHSFTEVSLSKEGFKPKCRFTDNWEQHKLEDEVSFFRGLTYKPSDRQNNGTLVLRSSNVKDNQIINADNVYVNSAIVNSVNVEPGDIIVVVRNGSKNLIGKHAQVVVHMPKTVIGAFMTGIRGKHNNFINALLSTDQFQNELYKNMGATINQITGYMFANMRFKFPSEEEQDAIGIFFKQLDNLIILRRDKIDKLKKLKSAYLNEMFPVKEEYQPKRRFTKVSPVEKEFKPKRRFAGFTDNWEQHKLGEVAKFINGRAYSQDELLNSGKYKVLRVGNFYTNDSWYYSNMELNDKYYANNGDLLYTWSATFGPHIWEGEKVIYHYHIWKLVLTQQLNKLFAVQLLIRDRNILESSTNGSTMAHITKKEMEEKIVFIPSDIKEQESIGKFLEKLDDSATLYQRKIDKLKKLKAAYLNEMFPAEGEYKSKCRFTDNWEQHKLGDAVNSIVAGGDINKSELLSKGSFPVYANTLTHDGVIGYYASKYRIKAPAVTVTGRGEIGVAKARNTNFTPVVRLLAIESSHNNYFLENLINTHRAYVESTGVPQLTVPKLSNYNLLFPTKIEEEILIGRFFSKLDTLLTLRRHKLDKLEKLRSAYLNEMFSAEGEYKPKRRFIIDNWE